MTKKIDYAKDKKKMDEYIRHLENKASTNSDVASARFFGTTAIHAMLSKVIKSKSSKESKEFWGKNLNTLNNVVGFIGKLSQDNIDINSYNEYNYELNVKLAEKLKVVTEENERLKKYILEDKKR